MEQNCKYCHVRPPMEGGNGTCYRCTGWLSSIGALLNGERVHPRAPQSKAGLLAQQGDFSDETKLKVK